MIVVVPVLQMASPAYAAVTAPLSLSASASSVVQGGTVTVYVYENSGSEPVNAVQANFTYPASSLQYDSISNSSAFGVVAQNSGGSGSVSIARGTISPVTGQQLVASVTFTALASSGSAALAIAAGSEVVSSTPPNNIVNGTSSGTSIALTAPVHAPTPTPTPKPTSSGSSSSSSKPSSSSSSATPGVPALQVSGVSVSAITTSSVTVTWTTNLAATSEVDYGLTESYGLSAVSSSAVTAHSVVLNSALIAPGTTYHFIVMSTDSSGKKATGTDATFTTAGTSLLITVLNQQTGKPVAGAKVSYGGKTATTNQQGQATLANLPLGKSTITVSVNGKSSPEVVQLDKPSTTLSPQKVFFKVPVQASLNGTLIVVIVLIVACLAALFGGMRLQKRGKNAWAAMPGAASVVVGGQPHAAVDPLAGLPSAVGPTSPQPLSPQPHDYNGPIQPTNGGNPPAPLVQ